MLKHIRVENIALIDLLDIDLGSGFNVLTGETGAGKSIIIDAISLLLGERASKEIIRSGAEKAKVEGVFSVSDSTKISEILDMLELEIEDDLYISREIYATGKSVCRINGLVMPTGILKSIGDLLADIHGQHEHQALLSVSSHIDFLDSYCSKESFPLLEEIKQLCIKLKELEQKLNANYGSEDEKARKIDILTYQIKEISQANLIPDEEELLSQEITLLANAEKIQTAFTESYQLLTGSDENALAMIRQSASNLSSISGFSQEYETILSRLNDAFYSLEDTAAAIRGISSNMEFDQEKLNKAEQRMDLIYSLKRKYGANIGEILRYMERCSQELDDILQGEERRTKYRIEIEGVKAEYYKAASKLTEIRKAAAIIIEKNVISQLMDLGIEAPEFRVRFEENRESIITSNGSDTVEFMLSTNIGEPLKPLSKVASGGEMSRIMLALKTVLSEADSVSTLIFDEIDTGISGRIASIVGEKIVSISKEHQVLCVTHLQQIAAFADHHYRIEKNVSDNKSVTSLNILSEEERPYELARIMGTTSSSEVALSHAAELIEKAKKLKSGR